MSSTSSSRRSRAAELAREEADRVEAELGETVVNPDTGEIIEAPAATDTTDADQEASMQAAFEAFEAENERHRAALAAIMGEDFEAFHECMGCGGVGFQPVTAPRFDPDLERCERCGGHGSMLTGSVNEMHIVRECLSCQGTGYTTKVQVPSVPAEPNGQPVWRFDPETGLPLQGGPTPAGQPVGGWAPGYTPPSGPAR